MKGWPSIFVSDWHVSRYLARSSARAARLQLGEQHLLEAAEHVAEIRWEGVQVSQWSCETASPSSRASSTAAVIDAVVPPQPITSSSPRSGPFDLDGRDLVCDALDLLGAQLDHLPWLSAS